MRNDGPPASRCRGTQLTTRPQSKWSTTPSKSSPRESGSCLPPTRETVGTRLVGRGGSEQGHEHLRVRTAPARDGVPAWACSVAGDRPVRELRCVAASARDVVKGFVVPRTARDSVDGRVDQTEVAFRVLVGERDDPSPDRCARTRAAVFTDRVARAAVACDNRDSAAGVRGGVGGYVRDAAHRADPTDSVLIGGAREEVAEAPA